MSDGQSAPDALPARNPQAVPPAPVERIEAKRVWAKDALASVLGVLILVAFGAFVVYMLRNLALNETQWTRAVFLFGGVEAVAFAAAGYFFGTQVQRGKVQEAQAEAKAAEKVAEKADETASAERAASTMLAESVVNAAPAGGLMGPSDGNDAMRSVVAQAEALLRSRRR